MSTLLVLNLGKKSLRIVDQFILENDETVHQNLMRS